MLNKNNVVIIGTFDGVHRGHQHIIEQAIKICKKNKGKVIAVTFDIPPRLFLKPKLSPYLLTCKEEKQQILTDFGVSSVDIIRFSLNFSIQSPDLFFEEFIYQKYLPKHIIVGYNFMFGKDRLGTVETLRELGKKRGIQVHIVPPFCDSLGPISSGRVRQYLQSEQLDSAIQLLGYPYRVSGRVEKGQGLGGTLGFPTANLTVDLRKILPQGVYLVQVYILKISNLSIVREKIGFGICNIGFRPTISISKNKKISCEIHILNFSKNIYGKKLQIDILKFLRSEKKFKNIISLKKQLVQDKKNALDYIQSFTQ